MLALIFVITAPSASAKHVAPAKIEPVVHQGVRYVVPNDNGLRAYVEAWDVQTGRKLWTKTVFGHWYVPVPFGKTECMHYEYITSMTLQTNLVTLTSERGREYTLDTRTRTIRQIKTKRPNKAPQRTAAPLLRSTLAEVRERVVRSNVPVGRLSLSLGR